MTTTRKPKPLTREQIRKGLNDIPMDTLILGTAAKHAGASLTPKQREFARLVALGESKAGSYRKAYNSKGKPTTAAREGHQLSRNPNIAAMTEAFAEAKRFTESHTPEQLRAFVIQQLAKHAADDEMPPAVRVKALELIGKHSEVQSFETRAVVTHVKASGDIRSRIMDKLKLIGASTTIENNAAQDDEQDADSLLQELTGTGVEAQDDDTTPTGEPLNRGVDDDIGAHIIPHIQSPSDPHIQVSSNPLSDPHPDVADGVVSDSICSPVSDSTPSAKADTGLEVDDAQMSPVQCTGENS